MPVFTFQVHQREGYFFWNGNRWRESLFPSPPLFIKLPDNFFFFYPICFLAAFAWRLKIFASRSAAIFKNFSKAARPFFFFFALFCLACVRFFSKKKKKTSKLLFFVWNYSLGSWTAKENVTSSIHFLIALDQKQKKKNYCQLIDFHLWISPIFFFFIPLKFAVTWHIPRDLKYAWSWELLREGSSAITVIKLLTFIVRRIAEKKKIAKQF